MLPNFVVIGAQKSASTFLQTCMSEHPDVYMPEGETPFFESPDYDNSTIAELERLLDTRKEKRIGIKRPSYIGKPEVPERITTHLPQAKLIAVLRNPVERAVSAYYHNIFYGFIPPIDIERGMRKLLTEPSFSKKYRRSVEIIEFGFYFKYLRQYDHFFKNRRILVLLHDDIVSDPLGSVQETFRFLDIDPSFVPASLNARPQKVIYSLPRLKLLWFRSRFTYDYNVERTRVFDKKQNSIDKAFDKLITKIDYKFFSKLSNDKPELSLELQYSLYELYKNDIEALESLISRNLNVWKLE